MDQNSDHSFIPNYRRVPAYNPLESSTED